MNKNLDEHFPLCKKYNEELFTEVQHHYLIMCEVCEKMNVPVEELIEFFYKGRMKLIIIQEQEEVLEYYDNESDNTM